MDGRFKFTQILVTSHHHNCTLFLSFNIHSLETLGGLGGPGGIQKKVHPLSICFHKKIPWVPNRGAKLPINHLVRIVVEPVPLLRFA